MVVAQAQLPLRTHHAAGIHATNLGRFQRGQLAATSINETGAHLGEGYLLPLGHVGRAADNLLGSFFSDVHRAEDQPVGVGVPLHPLHEAHGAVHPPANGNHVSHFQTRHSQSLGKLFNGHVEVHQLFQPGQGNLHRAAAPVERARIGLGGMRMTRGQ